LIARKADIRVHHFAHSNGIECTGAAETALHLAVKECLKRLDSLSLPSFSYFQQYRQYSKEFMVFHRSVAKGGVINIDRVDIEKSIGGIVVDALVYANRKKLIVEVRVTHKVDAQKLQKIRELDIASIEIVMNVGDALLSLEDLRSKVQQNLHSKKWLYHPNLPQIEAEYKKELDEARRVFENAASEKKLIELDRTPDEWWDLAGVGKLQRKNIDYLVAMRKFFITHHRYPTVEESRVLHK